ncbi:OTU domain-containing protein 6B [Forsythia ovata]|uniref:OTU domain-containing protein 6B n=1 Tax=Forsythia ovata TaxID=205694 RepID=A0ABD1T6W2_9LAMI
MVDATQLEHKLSEEISENTPDKKQETHEEMEKDPSTEQENCNEKGSKAEEKAKKKQVDEYISKLSTKLKEANAEEFASLCYNSSGAGNGRGNINNLIKAFAGFQSPLKLTIQNLAKASGMSKDLNRKLLENKKYKKSRAKSQVTK